MQLLKRHGSYEFEPGDIMRNQPGTGEEDYLSSILKVSQCYGRAALSSLELLQGSLRGVWDVMDSGRLRARKAHSRKTMVPENSL